MLRGSGEIAAMPMEVPGLDGQRHMLIACSSPAADDEASAADE
ncbi:hypothetical protein L21SP2_0255 [Salinispira pacifica]|uniref:Uncharacterized protein n=1 Tax=Salinispira pacifica TaxID=1307761 RepID=V5WD28_9SPIO|nr:hypothetical protein L21SP2_0255 [Salinispira pacifica]